VASFVIDENMPRSTAPALREAGYEVVDIRDAGLRGADDSRIFSLAQSLAAALITADLDFSSILSFRPGQHAGIVLVRMPDKFPKDALNREILRSLTELSGESL
jgi:predicted nuclease of predicted toxin-antitoxin system